MLFTTTCTWSLLLIGIQSVAAGHQAPKSRRDVQADIPSNIKIVLGKPELIVSADRRSIDLGVHIGQRGSLPILPRALTANQTDALNLHNKARAKKKIKALVWDSKLEKDAKAWAVKLAKSGKLEHSTSEDRPNQGENLAYVSSSQPISAPMSIGTKGCHLSSRLAEIKDYHNEIIPKGNFSDYGHYTQCMWNTTLKIGIATASNGKGAWFTVARYSPPGNYVGRRPY
ncbi:hypothetical protein AK830_g6067 [Neonectria ditissima]|uniref:SCP domain-containing protein n=1 Tax=Neonectria ditissima TaxID=78410 RepID=A0A0P7BJP0_9HYPO|nr:hypothetical protein AK830_g6067 [Neonectria ditissima]